MDMKQHMQSANLHFADESSNLQYQGYSTIGKMPAKNEMDAGSGIM